MKDKEAREAIRLTKERIDFYSEKITRIEQYLDRMVTSETVGRIRVPIKEPRVGECNDLYTLKQAVQHIIECLGITCSKDKFNTND